MENRNLKETYKLYCQLQVQYHTANCENKKVIRRNLRELQQYLVQNIQELYTLTSSY